MMRDAVTSIRAVVVDPNAPGRLAIHEVEPPVPKPNEALVRVAAFSLNRGEIRRASVAQPGWRPGWDLAGMVEQAASDGSGPPVGTRVVGILNPGSWAEVVAVPTHSLAELPDSVSFVQASTLPVAGLTALRALELGGLLLERTVLITGASGGVGHFACQLARQAGAHVVGAVGKPEHEAAVREAGAQEVIVGEDVVAAQQFGPYHLILESVGGRTLSTALPLLAADSICVLFGTTAGAEVTFNAQQFYLIGGATLYGFILFHELEREPAASDLRRLAEMVANGRLQPHISVEAPWVEVGNIAQQLVDRRLTGKAVLHIVES
jgi:NADPH2:quinone reductase